MTTVKQVATITPCDTGRLASVMCDVTLDDGRGYRVRIERNADGDWQLDRTYPDRDLHATLLGAAGCLADEIEARQTEASEEVTVKELWRYTPVGRRLKAIGCDVTCNGKTYRVSASRDDGCWMLLASFVDRDLHDQILQAVIDCALRVERELSDLRRQLSNRPGRTSQSKKSRAALGARRTPSMA